MRPRSPFDPSEKAINFPSGDQAWINRYQGQDCELHALAAVDSATPRRAFRIGDISDPLAVSREIHHADGWPTEIGTNLLDLES